ncbi:MAG: SusC/RagA family TonB-linked outer membrane protein [Muribaculaceae bacterium]|nr:SusC/RagA family TonB-linked outer membrane protein [Bacteroides sp.]MDE6071814.1 SusC/RagA family TonB-linked outer membrane protein [Muribaculaceae bacterium]
MVLCVDSFAQSHRNVTVGIENGKLKTLFESIEKQSDYVFSYRDDLIKNKHVTINLKDAPVQKVLDKALAGTNLSYKIVSDKSIIITEATATAKKDEAKTSVSGTVVDQNGEPIIGGTVLVKGTQQGTSTDLEGNYTLNNVPVGATLVFASVGYNPVEIKASNTARLAKVEMLEDSQLLDAVVVVGYGTQKRANLTGAVSTIGADDLNNRPVSSAAGALQGADPSVNLTFNTGSLDSDYSVNIRGVASINGGSPLVICDGMEVSLSQINPNDIESISVLKDASSSAIYGAKASSGVILITTKSGKNSDGKVNVNYSGRVGWRQNTTSTDFITTGYDHVSIVNEFYEKYQGKKMWGYTDDEMQMLYDRRNDKTENPDRPWAIRENGKLRFYANYDWYDYFYRKTRPETEHNLSVTGGNKNLNYFVSGRFLSQDGIFKIYNDNFKNYSFRAKLNAKLFSFVRYSGNFNFNATEYKYAGYYNEQATIHNLQSNINSAVMPFTPEGNVVQYVNTMTGANSPLGAGHGGFLTANEARNSRGNKDVIITNQLDFDITKDLVITGSYSYRYRNRQINRRNMPFDYEDKNGKMTTFTSGTVLDYYQEIHNNINRHSVNVYATYNHLWKDAHNFTAVAGFQFEDDRNTQVSVRQDDLLSKDLSSFSVATGATTLTQSIAAYRTLGYFARVNYDYQGKYLVEASGRFDGTSRFAKSDRWGFFPSASFGWRMSQESFWEQLASVWSNSKLRFSVGSLGNQQVNTYAYFDQIATDNIMSSYTFDGANKANYASVSDPISSALTWETVTTYNFGLDLGFFNNRLSATADVFIRDTKNMLTQSLTLPSVFGAKTPKENCADLRTNGWELYVRWNDEFKLAGRPFNYSVSATIGDYKSKITKYNNPDRLLSSYYEGKVLGEIWGYSVAGLFATDEEAAAYQAQINDKAVNQRVYNSKNESKLMAGDVKFIDLDGDNVISEGSGTVDNPGDMRVIGNSLPRYNYSFRADLSYFGFDVSAFFQGVGKQDWYPTQNAYDFWGPYSFPSLSFIHTDFMKNVWSEENPNAYFPRPRGYASYSGGALGVVNDRYLQNAAYLRLKNLTVGYTIPLKSKKVINQLRVYFTGENLFYWSPLKKYTKTVDPELTNTSSTYNAGTGVGYGYSRSYSVGVDLKF